MEGLLPVDYKTVIKRVHEFNKFDNQQNDMMYKYYVYLLNNYKDVMILNISSHQLARKRTMHEICKYIDSLKNTTKIHKKKKILKEISESEYSTIFQTILYYTYSPRKKFYIKQIPNYIARDSDSVEHNIFEFLDKLSNRIVTGKKAINELKRILETVPNCVAKVLTLIIQKDLRCGINTKIINSIFGKNFIEETPYMGCISYNKKKVEKLFNETGYLYSQTKVDGRYVNVIVHPDSVILESRSGEIVHINSFDILKEIDFSKLPDHLQSGFVLNGEMIIPGFDRYKSNGIIQQSLKKQISFILSFIF